MYTPSNPPPIMWRAIVTNPKTGETRPFYGTSLKVATAAVERCEDETPVGKLPDQWIVELERLDPKGA